MGTYRQTDRQTHGKPPIRVLMYDRKKRKIGLKRSAGACEQAGTVERLLHRRNPKNAKKRYPQTHRHTDTQTHGKPPIRVLMYRRNPKNAKKRSPQTDRQTHGKPPIRVLMHDRKKRKMGLKRSAGACEQAGWYRRRAVASSKSE